MERWVGFMLVGVLWFCPLLCLAQDTKVQSATVPFVLDHNRMLVEAEIQGKDGNWHKARLWVDTGNPDFFISPGLASNLGIETGESAGAVEIPPPTGVRIGGMPLDFQGVKTKVLFNPPWLFSTMHNDANLPSTVLMKYLVQFDYPGRRFTIAQPGKFSPRGQRVPATVNPTTGIVQVDTLIGGESFSFALDNGASFGFVSEELLAHFSKDHPDWPQIKGAVGCANIWGWWPEEGHWSVMRLPEIQLGPVGVSGVGLVGLPKNFPIESGVGSWYSQKTARPVVGFLGPNAFKAFRLAIDYANSAVFFNKEGDFDSHDMDLVGLTLRPEADGSYQVIGIATKQGKPVVEGVEQGDILLQIGKTKVKGATMGTVVDALRGKPGDRRTLLLERHGKQIKVKTRVVHYL